jgi:hypothetical protein
MSAAHNKGTNAFFTQCSHFLLEFSRGLGKDDTVPRQRKENVPENLRKGVNVEIFRLSENRILHTMYILFNI